MTNHTSRSSLFRINCLHGVWLLALAMILAMPAPGVQAQRVDPLADLDRDQRRVFKNYTRLFCAQFFRYGENRFVILPNHYTKRENSTGRTYNQVREEMTEVRREKRGLAVVDVKYPPPDAEVVAAAKILPQMDVGHYGYINEVTVSRIIGPEEMIVSKIELIPREMIGREKNATRMRLDELQRSLQYKSYRVLGFRTKNLSVGQRFNGANKKGLHVAVMSTDTQHSFVLVNYDKLERVRTSDFHEVLGYVKMSPLAFLDMVRGNRERLLSEGDKTSLISIYRRFYSRYRPTTVSKRPPIVRPRPPVRPDPIEEEDKPDPVEEEDTPDPVEEEDTPDPVEEEDDDDGWEFEESDSPDEVEFFGIPLGE